MEFRLTGPKLRILPIEPGHIHAGLVFLGGHNPESLARWKDQLPRLNFFLNLSLNNLFFSF